MKMPPLKSIQYFVVTAKHLSFSRAADELCITQSAVSHQVKLLEQFLGKSLLGRQGKRVCLTQEGDDFFGVAKDALERLESVSAHVKLNTDITLRVVTQTSIAVDWLAEKIPLFTALFPDIRLLFTMETAAASFDSQDYDIVIGTWPTPDNFVTKSLRVEKWFPVCTPELAEQIDQDNCLSIYQCPLYTSENGSDWQFWSQRMQIRPPANVLFQHFGVAILATKASLAGKGVALSNHFLTEKLIADNKLVSFTQWQYELPWGQYFVHYRKDSHHATAMNSFVSWLLKQVQYIECERV